MSELSSDQLLAGLHQLGTGVSLTAGPTVAFLSFKAPAHADIADITPLQDYPYLQNIDLSHNVLTSLSALSACSSLRQLDVSHNSLGVLLDFAPPRALRCVSYSHNQLAGVLDFDAESARLRDNFPHIEKLDLAVNRLEEIRGIGGMKELRELNVARNQLTSLSSFSCPALVSLDASGNFLRTLSTLPVRALASSLRTLRLDDNQLSSLPGLEHLTLLTELSLRHNALASLDELARLVPCQNLVQLDLRGNPLTEDCDDGAAPYRLRLLHLLPGLRVLDGVPVTPQEVVEAHNEVAGADSQMRRAITHLYLPRGEATQKHMAPRTVPPLDTGAAESKKGAVAAAAATTATATQASTNANTTILPESQYWSLLTERKFMTQFTDFVRVAKERIKLDPIFDDQGEEQGGVGLDLSGVSLGEAGCWALSEVLSVRRAQIARIDLSYSLHPLRWSTALSDSYGLRRLLRSMSQLQGLQSLSLTHCHLGREGATLLAGYLSSPAARAFLRALHLQHNRLGENVTTTLPEKGEMVIVHAAPGLREIVSALACAAASASGSGNGEHDDDPMQGQGHALEYLNLSNNLIDAQGARIIAEYIDEGRTASSNSSAAQQQQQQQQDNEVQNEFETEQLYDEEGNALDPPAENVGVGAGVGAPSRPRPPISLRTLLLDSNPFLQSGVGSDGGLGALALSLRGNTSLTTLSLRGNAEASIDAGGFESLAHSVGRYNRTLTHLDLGQNPNIFAGRDERAWKQRRDEIVEQQQQQQQQREEEEEAEAAAAAAEASEEQDEKGEEKQEQQQQQDPPVSTPSLLAASLPSLDRRASLALSSLLFHSLNGVNQSGGCNLLSLRLDGTGFCDGVVGDVAAALAANQTLKHLDLGANGAGLTEAGLSLLFQALARRGGGGEGGEGGGGLRTFHMAGVILGERSALRLAEWLSRPAAAGELEELGLGVLARRPAAGPQAQRDPWGQLTTEGEEAIAQSEEQFQALWDAQQQRRNEDEEGDEEAETSEANEEQPQHVSELAMTTLAGAIHLARTTGRLERLALGNLGRHMHILLEQLAAPTPVMTEEAEAEEAEQEQVETQDQDQAQGQGGDEDEYAAIPRSHVSASPAPQLLSLDLSGNTHTRDSLSLLSQVVAAHPSLRSLRLCHSAFSFATYADPDLELESSLCELVATVLANPACTELDLSGSSGLGLAGLQGVGAALLGPEGQGVMGAALQVLDLAFCGLEEFGGWGEEQGHGDTAAPTSNFLAALQCDATTLTSLSLRGNDFSAAELRKLMAALDANWNLRNLNLSDIVLRQGEESLALMRTAVTHAVSHGLGTLQLPSVRQPSSGAGSGVDKLRDALVGAVADGWRQGVATGTSFLREHARTPESVLHQLRLDIGAGLAQGAPLTWQQKQRLLEAVRPLAQSSTVGRAAEESFRLLALTAGGVPLRLNTQQHSVCGVDLVENALAGRLACQRM